MTDAPTRLHRVLVATDLSPLGNAAVDHAFAAVADGGAVQILHVVYTPPAPSPLYPHYSPLPVLTPEERTAIVDSVQQRLRALVPGTAAARGVKYETVVVEAEDVVVAIDDAAGRFGADVVCLGTHGRSVLGAALLGSIALRAIHALRRPLLLVPAREK